MQRRLGTTIIIAGLSLGLAACSSGTPPTASLADTKSPVQLLRNESILRLPSADIGSVESTDESVGCDGDKSVRRWNSAAIITLSDSAGQKPDAAITTLAASFEEDGWVVSPGNEREDDEQAVLTSGTSAAEIRLIAHAGTPATVTIEAAGPCVQTDGPDSEEVRKLEI